MAPGAVRLLNLGPTAWTRTQSVYRSMAEAFAPDSPAGVVCAQPLQRYLTHGSQHSAAEAFDLTACARLGLPVAGRPFAGGPRYHDVHHLMFQWILPDGGAEALIAGAVCAALRELGLACEYANGDVHSGGVRLGWLEAGACGSAFVLLGCLHLQYDPGVLARTARAPSAEAASGVWAESARPIAPDQLQAVLLEHFARALGRPIERDRPRVEETRRARLIERALIESQAAHLPSAE